jgi:hypothetical protein
MPLAYSDSADANPVSDAYLADGEAAQPVCRKALALLDFMAPASSWSATEERRGIRRGRRVTLARATKGQW